MHSRPSSQLRRTAFHNCQNRDCAFSEQALLLLLSLPPISYSTSSAMAPFVLMRCTYVSKQPREFHVFPMRATIKSYARRPSRGSSPDCRRHSPTVSRTKCMGIFRLRWKTIFPYCKMNCQRSDRNSIKIYVCRLAKYFFFYLFIFHALTLCLSVARRVPFRR